MATLAAAEPPAAAPATTQVPSSTPEAPAPAMAAAAEPEMLERAASVGAPGLPMPPEMRATPPEPLRPEPQTMVPPPAGAEPMAPGAMTPEPTAPEPTPSEPTTAEAMETPAAAAPTPEPAVPETPAPEAPAAEAAMEETAVEEAPVEEEAETAAAPAEAAEGETAEEAPAPTAGGGGAAGTAPAAGEAAPAEPTAAAPEAPEAGAGGEAPEGTEAAEPEAAPEPPSPRAAIAPAARGVRSRARDESQHTPTGAAVGAAQSAAIDPATEQQRTGATQTVTNIDAAEPEDVDRRSFKDELKEALRKAVPVPRTESQAERLMEEGAGDASAMLEGEVGAESANAAAPLTAGAAPENEAEAEAPPAPEPLAPEAVGDAPAPVSPASVVPDPIPAERLDYSDDRADTDALMAENDITHGQLERGNDPTFTTALGARDQAETHEAQAPQDYRQAEAGQRDAARGRAAATLQGGLDTVHQTRAGRVATVALQQVTTQTSDSSDRARVTAAIEEIKTRTQEAVNTILEDMETRAATKFQDGLARAENEFEEVFEEEKGSWLSRAFGLADIQEALDTARRRYERVVDEEIDKVATFVEGRLDDAKVRVREGKQEVDRYVAELDGNLARYGEEARASIAGDFDAMVGEIDSRRDGLIDALADQYRQSRQRLAETEERLRQENRSIWERAYDATVGVVEKIIEFKNMLLGILARAAAVVGAIIDDPIGFLGNLISGIKAGLDAFVGNIGQHLMQGLMGWLFGALEGAGIQIPATFDLRGIIDLVLQVLGLTYANIRARAVRILGEETVARLEQVAEIFKVLVTEGPAGLWRMLVEKLGDVKEMILGEIREWVITKIIVAGVKWLVSLLNPASAFVKACMMIYDIVKFFIERGQQIISLVNAIIDALGAIVAGNISAMAQAVEGALARIVPVAISFLAALLGLGGISEKIRQVIETIQRPVNQAIDWVINKAVALARKVGGLFGGGEQQEPPEEQEFEEDDPAKQLRVDEALEAIDFEERASAENGHITRENAEAIATKVKRDHPVLTSLRVIDGDDSWDYEYEASPKKKKEGEEKAETESDKPENFQEIQDLHLVGKPVADFDPPPPSGYTKYKRNDRWVIKRLDMKLQQLGVGPDDKIVLGEGRSPAAAARNEAEMRAELGPAKENQERHHLIPLEVATSHPLVVEATKRGAPKYRVNGGLIYLPASEEAAKEIPELHGLPIHSGYHREWSARVSDLLDDELADLLSEHASLDTIPEKELTESVLGVQRYLRNTELKKWSRLT